MAYSGSLQQPLHLVTSCQVTASMTLQVHARATVVSHHVVHW